MPLREAPAPLSRPGRVAQDGETGEETGLNKTKRVAWHKHLAKGRKYREQRQAKAAAQPAPAAAKR